MTTYSKDRLDTLVFIYNELHDFNNANLQEYISYFDTFLALAWGVSMELCEPSEQLLSEFDTCYDSFVALVGDIDTFFANPDDYPYNDFVKPQGIVYV